MLQSLLNVNVDRLDIDEAVALLAFGKMVSAEYGSHNIQCPDKITDAVNVLAKDVEARRKDYLQRRLKELRAQKETLKTVSEKRNDVEKELQKLEAELA